MTQEVNPLIIVPEDPQTDTIRVPVLKVFDGDGFLTRVKVSEFTGNPRDQAEIEITARFGFIDAPEMEQPGGREARDFLTALIGDRWVELAILLKMNTGRSVDTYGRVVCVPYLTLGGRGVQNNFVVPACHNYVGRAPPRDEKHRAGDGR